MSSLQRPLDRAAVRAADDEFYARHPEMIDASGRRIPLSATNPAQAGLRSEWRELYLANGGKLEEEGAAEPASPTQHCPYASPEPEPTLVVRWSKPEVTPDHNSSYPPATAPTDTVPEEAKVKLIGETANVPDGKSASMTIFHCEGGGQITEGVLSNLVVRGGKVVDEDTGVEPEWAFSAKHGLWDPWDKPYYYFRCAVDYRGLSAETPRDFAGEAARCLRLKYWHYCVAESSTLSGVLPECNTVSGILNGVAHSKSSVQNLTTVGIPLADYGSLLRNTYVFHMASHGNALKRSDNSAIPVDDPGDAYTQSEYRSIVHITPVPRFGDTQIADAANVPSTPRYLFYSSTCLTGWEPSFANAMIARGTRNVIAFRRTIPDSEAPQMAQKFYQRWAGTHRLDPEKIPDCFFQSGADHYDNMKPILYGEGGGAIEKDGLSPLAIAAIVVGAVAVGALIGVALYSALK